MAGWEFYGSEKNETYELLHYKNRTTELFSNGIGCYEIEASSRAFQSFKIKQTLMSNEGTCGVQMRLSGFELFGTIVPLTYCEYTIKQCKSKSMSLIYLLVCLISVK